MRLFILGLILKKIKVLIDDEPIFYSTSNDLDSENK